MRLKVLGIDPGSVVTGFGIVEQIQERYIDIVHGEIRLKRGTSFTSSLEKIYDELFSLVEREQPDAVAIEDIFYGKNIKSLIKQGHVRGVAILAGSKHHLPVFEYTPLEIKKAVVGYGHAEKIQVQNMIKVIMKLSELPPADASDAIAVAICHLNHQKKNHI
ncbi:MAG: Crossover junction endodeoxyribonuclease RuvC [Syntrophus sp. PtaB.Bin001]|nr:crossover junction endodeoxyribonuclease RuvC [Syntrophus aciditrophicus]OPY13433.1 MAG: Crossover junction endodeoxyribonuclease RuvC [Syntrophus sp. PtaB.Bin001]